MDRRGYQGEVTLRSPSGEYVTIKNFPGRWRDYRNKLSTNLNSRKGRKFHKLLSAGWKVVACNGQTVGVDNNAGEEEKKDTSLVVGTTQTGNSSHGGKHASCEVEDSPNVAKEGKKRRGCRGGQKKRTKRKRSRRAKRTCRLQVQNAGQNGGPGVYAPQSLWFSDELLESAEESAELLAKLIGRSPLKVRQGVKIDVEKLLVALETGDDPLPALETPDEKSKLKILVTPDCSGSCQSWSGLGRAWALHLSKLPDVDVIYFENFNGKFWDVEEGTETQKLIESVDVVLYLGDGDGWDLSNRYASYGAIVVALDSYCANVAKPRLEIKTVGQGTLHWVDRVSAHEPRTWTQSIELCLQT